jgi:hypothetical protein
MGSGIKGIGTLLIGLKGILGFSPEPTATAFAVPSGFTPVYVEKIVNVFAPPGEIIPPENIVLS